MHTKLLSGYSRRKKTFEIRLADWKCMPGDMLILNEYNPKTKKYTGRILRKKVSYVLKTKDLKFFNKKKTLRNAAFR